MSRRLRRKPLNDSAEIVGPGGRPAAAEAASEPVDALSDIDDAMDSILAEQRLAPASGFGGLDALLDEPDVPTAEAVSEPRLQMVPSADVLEPLPHIAPPEPVSAPAPAAEPEAPPAGPVVDAAPVLDHDLDPDQVARLVSLVAEWVNFSTKSTSLQVSGDDLVAYLTRLQNGGARAEAVAPTRRFFCAGDVFRNATLEFDGQSVVEVESRFVNCTVRLKEGAQLIIGPQGVFDGTRVVGPGEVVVHGAFAHQGDEPGIAGPQRLIVKASGSLVGTVQQHATQTQFGLERGCRLRMKIVKG